MPSGRSLAGFAGSRPHQGDQSEAVNTKPGCRANPHDRHRHRRDPTHTPPNRPDRWIRAKSVDQALNLVTRVSYPSYASRPSADPDGMDAMDDLDVATAGAGPRVFAS